MSFTLGLIFFYSKIKHFLVYLRLFKIHVADQKSQTIISFYPIYSILHCVIEKEGLMTNSNADFINVELF